MLFRSSIPNTTPNIDQSIPIGYNYMNGTDYLVGAGGGARWQVNGTSTTALSNYTTGNGVWGTGAYYLGGSGVIMIV